MSAPTTLMAIRSALRHHSEPMHQKAIFEEVFGSMRSYRQFKRHIRALRDKGHVRQVSIPGRGGKHRLGLELASNRATLQALQRDKEILEALNYPSPRKLAGMIEAQRANSVEPETSERA